LKTLVHRCVWYGQIHPGHVIMHNIKMRMRKHL
jgi:hypothetical protein